MTTIRVRDLKAGDRIKLWFEGEKYYDTSTERCVVATVVDLDAGSRTTTVRYAGDNGEEGATRLYTDGVVEAAETVGPEKPTAVAKYDKSEIMKKAHMLRRDHGLDKSAALKQAWKLAKDAARKAEARERMAAAGFMAADRGDIHEAFYAQHPNGTIRSVFGEHKVQFEPGGKIYSYGIKGIFKLLGFTA